MSESLVSSTPPAQLLNNARLLRDDFNRFMLEYEFAVDEVLTKVDVLRREFLHLHKYNPIEHISSRVKNPDSLLEKAMRKGLEPSLEAIRENITDIAGIRITCSFISDTYTILELLSAQDDIEVIEIKDYIANPKPNGYKSLHALLQVPIFLSTGKQLMTVEVQIRTIAMDFWASLEHKIFYKYQGTVPAHLAQDLTDAASAAELLDKKMEELYAEVHGAGAHTPTVKNAQTMGETEAQLLWEFFNSKTIKTAK